MKHTKTAAAKTLLLCKNKKNKQMGSQTAFMENSGIQKTVMRHFRTVRKKNEFNDIIKTKGRD